MMENLVEKAREILPHQITGAEPTHAPDPAAYPNTSTVGTRVGALLLQWCRPYVVQRHLCSLLYHH